MHKLLVIALATFAFVSAQAEQKKAQPIVQSVERSYGIAGCGVGSMLFGAQPGGIQIVAATTNGSFYNQMFGITFGTVNCDIPEAGMQAAVYIEKNREVVSKEAARGQGETLVGLANILKCSDQSTFNKAAQDHFEEIFVESDNAYSNVHNLYKVINNNQTLKSSCNLQG